MFYCDYPMRELPGVKAAFFKTSEVVANLQSVSGRQAD